MWCHVLNRGNRGEVVFHKPADYDAFVNAMADAQTRLPVDILGYCLVPKHFHLAGDSDTHELVGRTNRPAHPLSEPRGGLRPSFSR